MSRTERDEVRAARLHAEAQRASLLDAGAIVDARHALSVARAAQRARRTRARKFAETR